MRHSAQHRLAPTKDQINFGELVKCAQGQKRRLTPSPSDELLLFSDVLVKSIGMAPALLRAKLPECAQPILHMEGFRDLPVTDRLDVDRYHGSSCPCAGRR